MGEAPARDRRPAARARRRRRRRLLPHARRLPPRCARGADGRALRRDRRRLHRLGDRGGAHRRRRERDDGLPGAGHRVARSCRPSCRRSSPDYYREHGVEVLAGETVDRGRAAATVDDRLRPRRSRPTSSSPGSGSSRTRSSPRPPASPVDNGIVVDEYGRVGGRDDVFAAGDVASFPIAALGTHVPRRARGSREHARPDRRREHGRRGDAVRPPAVLLLRHVRPRLRGGRRGRLAAARRSSAGTSRTARASSRTSTRRGGRAASCSGTRGTRWTRRAS